MAFLRPDVEDEPAPDPRLAGVAAADDLLIKAIDALAAGDDDLARGYAQRAAELPYDPVSEGNPGWHAAGMTVVNSLTDAEEEGEPWLDAVERVIADDPAGPEGWGSRALRATLAAAGAEWELVEAERTRCSRLAHGSEDSLWFGVEPAEPADRVEPILAALRATLAFEAALA